MTPSRLPALASALAVAAVMAAGCGQKEEPAAAAPVAAPAAPVAAPAPAPRPVPAGQVLTAEDMQKLAEDRKSLVDRPTPLGEEKDPVEALRPKD